MMKLIIEIESDTMMFLKVLRSIADDLEKNTLFTLNEFKCELKDLYGESVVGYITQTNDKANGSACIGTVNPDGSTSSVVRCKLCGLERATQ
jgi:hypothetical protein